jgi:hypothetical protein
MRKVPQPGQGSPSFASDCSSEYVLWPVSELVTAGCTGAWALARSGLMPHQLDEWMYKGGRSNLLSRRERETT